MQITAPTTPTVNKSHTHQRHDQGHDGRGSHRRRSARRRARQVDQEPPTPRVKSQEQLQSVEVVQRYRGQVQVDREQNLTTRRNANVCRDKLGKNDSLDEQLGDSAIGRLTPTISTTHNKQPGAHSHFVCSHFSSLFIFIHFLIFVFTIVLLWCQLHASRS